MVNVVNRGPDPCCPQLLGETCWVGGRVFVIRESDGSLTYIDQGGTGSVDPGDLIPCPDPNAWTTSETVIQRSEAIGVGAVAPGASSVTITNTGMAAGAVQGAPLAAGESISLTAYEDPVAREFNRLPEISFDATGTTFSITRMA